MMQSLLVFSAVIWIATVSGIALDFSADELNVEGFLPNNLFVDSFGSDLPMDDSAVNNVSDD